MKTTYVRHTTPRRLLALLGKRCSRTGLQLSRMSQNARRQSTSATAYDTPCPRPFRDRRNVHIGITARDVKRKAIFHRYDRQVFQSYTCHSWTETQILLCSTDIYGQSDYDLRLIQLAFVE